MSDGRRLYVYSQHGRLDDRRLRLASKEANGCRSSAPWNFWRATASPNPAPDAAALATRAARDGDTYVLNGQKQFISGADGDLYVVMARTGNAGPWHRTFVVPGDTPGISLGANERKMGWNAQPTRAVVFQDVRVPADNRLGAEGEGFKIAMAGLRWRAA